MTEPRTTTILLAPTDEPGRVKRRCGTCTLCCKLIPVQPLEKPAGTRCHYQRLTGCSIYARRPAECAVWFCKWLINDDAGELSRPDRAGYVIDMMPDYVTMTNNETAERQQIPVVQIWVDPKHRDAHRDPALRAWLERRGEVDGFAAIIRYSGTEGFVLFPPSMCADRQWHEVDHGMREQQHNFDDVLAAIAGTKGSA